jgi:hypothetical protein
MKKFFLIFLTFIMASAAWADSTTDLVHTAKAVKAIIEKGNKIPSVIDVEKVEQMSSPPKQCIMVIYDRKPNTECPDEYGQGPYMDKSFVTCFNSKTDEIDYVGGAESQCPPKL